MIKVTVLIFCFFCFFTQNLFAKNKITVAISPDYAPFEYMKNGKMVGIDIEIIKKISEKIGTEITIMPMDFNSIIAALTSKTVDIAISGMTKTKEREKFVDFSIGYYQPKTIVLCKSSDFCEEKYMQNSTTGVQTGTIQEVLVDKMSKTINIKKFTIKKITNGLNHLKKGDINFLLVDSIVGVKIGNGLKYFEILDKNSSEIAIAMRKDFDKKSEINQAIKQMQESGEIEKIILKHIGDNSLDEGLFKSSIWILKGSFVTIKYAISSFCLGFLLANIVIFARNSKNKILKSIAIAYTSIIRGVPVLVQLTFIYFLLPKLTGHQTSIFASGVIAFGVNSSAYLVEILYTGIKNVQNGQILAAKTLNIPKFYTYKDIIMPQAIRSIFPSLTQEIISLTKESAIISVIGEIDIMKRVDAEIARTYDFIYPLLTAAAAYYIICMAIFLLGLIIERRIFKYGRN